MRWVLGIETSCDDTGVALYDGHKHLFFQTLASQHGLHALYGGVVPELAARDHLKHLPVLLRHLLSEAQLTPSELDLVAYTRGPGLVGSLLVGAGFAKSLAYACGLPSVGVHHLEAHARIACAVSQPSVEPPFLLLLVSGGHTLLMHCSQWGLYHTLGQTLDDAAGEAFDKVASLMGLPYPGGPELAKVAPLGYSDRFTFSQPMKHRPGFDFSFSGLKTQAAQLWSKIAVPSAQGTADFAASFEGIVVKTLVERTECALEHTQSPVLIAAGGVAANERLRVALEAMGQRLGVQVLIPPPSWCTDNGAMVAYAGYHRARMGDLDEGHDIEVLPRWSLAKL